MRHIVLIWWSVVPIYFEIQLCTTKLPAGHDIVLSLYAYKEYAQTQVSLVTLTFEPVTLLLHVTHRLDTMICCANLFRNPIMHDKVMSWTRHSTFTICIKGIYTNSNCLLWPWPLGSDLVYYATHRLDMMIIYNLFWNLITHNKVTIRTRHSTFTICIQEI